MEYASTFFGFVRFLLMKVIYFSFLKKWIENYLLDLILLFDWYLRSPDYGSISRQIHSLTYWVSWLIRLFEATYLDILLGVMYLEIFLDTAFG